MPDSTATRSDFRAKLRKAGVTHEEIADAIGVGRSTISLWLAGEVSSPALDKAIPAYIAGLERGSHLANSAA